VIVKGVVETRKSVRLRRLFGILRYYCHFIHSSPLEAEVREHLESIQHLSRADTSYLREWKERLRRASYEYVLSVPQEKPSTILEFKPFKSVYYERMQSYEVNAIVEASKPFRKHIASLFTTRPSTTFPEILNRLGKLNLADLAERQLDRVPFEVTGRLNVLCDRGGKTRMFAEPSFWYQFVFKTLHRQLEEVVNLQAASCTLDQNKGAYWLQQALESGLIVYCFDLSSATDRFPLSLQEAVLEGLNLGSWIPALHDAVMHWQFRELDICYWTGQPMGLYSSFPLFHLTHILLLKALCSLMGVDAQNRFWVLGDDVFITCRKLAFWYEHLLGKFDVDISAKKSISSSSLGMFAGFLGVRVRSNKVDVFRPFKWSKSGEEQALHNLYHFLGKKLSTRRSHPMLEKAWASYEELRYDCNPDLSPLVPRTDPGGIPGPSTDYTRLIGTVLEQSPLELREEQLFLPNVTQELLGNKTWYELGIPPSERSSPLVPITASPANIEEQKIDDYLFSRSTVLVGNGQSVASNLSHQKVESFSIN